MLVCKFCWAWARPNLEKYENSKIGKAGARSKPEMLKPETNQAQNVKTRDHPKPKNFKKYKARAHPKPEKLKLAHTRWYILQ